MQSTLICDSFVEAKLNIIINNSSHFQFFASIKMIGINSLSNLYLCRLITRFYRICYKSKGLRMSIYQCLERNITGTYSYRQEIELQISKSITAIIPLTKKYRIVIRTASKMLRLNLLECSMLTWLIGQHELKYEELVDFCKDVRVFQEEIDNVLLLLLLLNGYYVKSYLTNCIQPIIDAQITSYIPDFKLLYHSWRPQTSLSNLSLTQINDLFNSWTEFASESKKDYNLMVSKILQLSKSYNIGGNEKQICPKKETFVEQVVQESVHLEKSVSELINLSNKFPEFHYNREEDLNWGDDEDRQINILEKSSRKYGIGEFNFDMNESRNVVDSKNNSGEKDKVVINNSAEKRVTRGKIKPTYSFFDDI